MSYIDELKNRVANRFGKPILNKPDSKELRDLIFQYQKEYLSESTIRRFFNLIPTGVTSRTTLDIFSRFIGFPSYSQFSDFCEKIIHFSTTNNTDAVILNDLKEKEVLSMLEVNLISHRINQCILDSNYTLLSLYFNDDKLFHLLTLNDTSHDLFAQALGPSVENELLLADVSQIMKSSYFIPLVLYKYVDIQNRGMERYYEWMVNNPKEPHDLIFAASILSLNRLYAGEYEKAYFYFQLIDKKEKLVSPVLNGRIALLNWVFSNDLDKLIAEAKKYEEQLLFFSIDLISYLVYFEKLDVLKIWFLQFPDARPNEKTWVEKEIYFFYSLAKYLALEDFKNLKLWMDQKVMLLNSNTTFVTIYPLIEERYIKKIN